MVRGVRNQERIGRCNGNPSVNVDKVRDWIVVFLLWHRGRLGNSRYTSLGETNLEDRDRREPEKGTMMARHDSSRRKSVLNFLRVGVGVFLPPGGVLRT